MTNAYQIETKKVDTQDTMLEEDILAILCPEAYYNILLPEDLVQRHSSLNRPWIEIVEENIEKYHKHNIAILPAQEFDTFKIDDVIKDTNDLLNKIKDHLKKWNLVVIDSQKIIEDIIKGDVKFINQSLIDQNSKMTEVYPYSTEDTKLIFSDIFYQHVKIPTKNPKDGSLKSKNAFIQLHPNVHIQNVLEWSQIDAIDRKGKYPLNRQEITFTNDHEIAHLLTSALNLRSIEDEIDRQDGWYQHIEECRADSFATVMSVLRFGDQNIHELMKERRDALAMEGDYQHWTSYMTDQAYQYALKLKKNGHTIETVKPDQLIKDIENIVQKNVLRDKEYSDVKDIIIKFRKGQTEFRHYLREDGKEELADITENIMTSYINYRYRSKAALENEKHQQKILKENPEHSRLIEMIDPLIKLEKNKYAVNNISFYWKAHDKIKYRDLNKLEKFITNMAESSLEILKIQQKYFPEEKRTENQKQLQKIFLATQNILKNQEKETPGPRMARIKRLEKIVNQIDSNYSQEPLLKGIHHQTSVFKKTIEEIKNNEYQILNSRHQKQK